MKRRIFQQIKIIKDFPKILPNKSRITKKGLSWAELQTQLPCESQKEEFSPVDQDQQALLRKSKVTKNNP